MENTDNKNAEKKERKRLLAPEGGFLTFMTKLGQLILLNIVWLISCLPVFTIGTATTSLYYAVMKNIRRSRGYPIREYLSSFKRTFASGSIATVVAVLWLLTLYRLRTIALAQGSQSGLLLDRMYLTLAVVTAAILIYLFPVMSRFTMSLAGMLKLSFVMMLRYIGYTVILVAVPAAAVWIWFYFLPMPLILVLPGIWCYISTFMIEKALRKYMPAPKEDEDAWYYE